MTVGVDVGNTAIKLLGLSDDDSIERFRLDEHNWPERLVDLLAGRLVSTSKPTDIRVSSVNRDATGRLLKAFDAAGLDKQSVRLIAHDDIPIRIATDHPNRVGIDRLVGAYGAWSASNQATVIIDAGTTVTVDLVRDSTFLGGAIMPGLQMQTSALFKGTDLLPEVNWDPSHCLPCDAPENASDPAGKNTADAIKLGILSNVVGGIQRLIRLYDNPSEIVITGGDGLCLSRVLQSEHTVNYRPSLICQTLRDLPLAMQ